MGLEHHGQCLLLVHVCTQQEYCCMGWNPHSTHLSKRIKAVEMRAARYVYIYMEKSSTSPYLLPFSLFFWGALLLKYIRIPTAFFSLFFFFFFFFWHFYWSTSGYLLPFSLFFFFFLHFYWSTSGYLLPFSLFFFFALLLKYIRIPTAFFSLFFFALLLKYIRIPTAFFSLFLHFYWSTSGYLLPFSLFFFFLTFIEVHRIPTAFFSLFFCSLLLKYIRIPTAFFSKKNLCIFIEVHQDTYCLFFFFPFLIHEFKLLR